MKWSLASVITHPSLTHIYFSLNRSVYVFKDKDQGLLTRQTLTQTCVISPGIERKDGHTSQERALITKTHTHEPKQTFQHNPQKTAGFWKKQTFCVCSFEYSLLTSVNTHGQIHQTVMIFNHLLLQFNLSSNTSETQLHILMKISYCIWSRLPHFISHALHVCTFFPVLFISIIWRQTSATKLIIKGDRSKNSKSSHMLWKSKFCFISHVALCRVFNLLCSLSLWVDHVCVWEG